MADPGRPLFAPLPAVVGSDPAALLGALSAAMDARDLRRIAEADRGGVADEHERWLRHIALSGALPSPLQWCPREVLELTRWDEPSPDGGDGVFRHRHRLRAFACTVLLRSYGDPCNADRGSGREATALHLIGSAAVLRTALPHFERDAASLLAWVIPRLAPHDPGDHPFLGLAALWFALGAALPDPALLALAAWVMDAEDAVSGQWREACGVRATGPWLLPLIEPRARRAAWRRVVLSLPSRLPSQCGPAVREAVALLASMMDG